MIKQTLFEPLVTHVKLGWLKIKLDTRFFRVLQCCEILDNDLFDDYEKITICLKLLIKHKIILWFLSPAKKVKLFETVFNDFVNVNDKKSNGPKTFDFNQDAAYIYTAFQQCYGLDLFKEGKRLHWWKFIQLFGCLSDDTMMRQIISIRARPIPKATKYNAEERAQLIRLKNLYRLEISQEEREKQLVEGFKQMAKVLGAMANEKN